MKEDTEVAWEEVPESGPENFHEGEEELGEEPGEKEGKDTPGPGRARATGKPTRMKLADGRPLGSKYPFELRKRLVLLHITKGISMRQIEQDSGVGKDTVRKWVIRYRESGEDGLQLGGAGNHTGRVQIPPAVKGIMIETKRGEPTWGVKKISQFLRRMLHLPGSPETVRQTLHAEKLIGPGRPRPRTPGKPRFFERSTPNQLWQSDIKTIRIGGKNAYLIGYMDDYSRYIVSLGVFRSQTCENVLDTYRKAAGEYGVPKELLTDNGRQYVAWRGTTRFQMELHRDGVDHILARPHHPMTLGKIERFWLNINDEFLLRTTFDTFEQAQERIALWVKYYNHKRPHQGIGGMCPADRFFEVRSDLRKVIERGIEDNLVELALRGKPQKPFYMVGRVDGQSVVMQASKGKLLMTVGDNENNQKSEVLCDLQEGKVTTHENENGSEDGKAGAGAGESGTGMQVYGAGEVPGGARPVDGAQHGVGAVQGDGHDMEHAEPLAGAGHGGDDAGPRAEAESGARELAPEPEAAGTSGPQSGPPAGRDGEPDAAEPGPREAPEAAEGRSPGAPAPALSPGITLTPELAARLLEMLAAVAAAGYDNSMKGGAHHEEGSQEREGGGPAGPAPAGCDGRQEDLQRSCGDARHLPQVMARLAEGGARSPAPGHDARGARPPAETRSGPGTSKTPEGERGTGEADQAAEMLGHDPQGDFRPDRPES